jgi:apolipoprotein N-acyltransferase
VTPKRWAWLVAGAVVAGLSFLPGPQGPLLAIAGSPLLFALRGATPVQAAVRGFLYGSIAWMFGILWFPAVAIRYSAGPAWLGVVFYLVIIAYFAAEIGIGALLSRAIADALGRRGWSEPAALAAGFVPAFAALDAYYPQMYPAPLAATLASTPILIQTLDLLGTAGPALLILGVNACAFAALSESGRRRSVWAAAGIGLAVSSLVYGGMRMRSLDAASEAARESGPLVALIQESIPAEERAVDELRERNVARYRALTREAERSRPDLIVWPEFSYERAIESRPNGGYAVGPEPAAAAITRDAGTAIPVLVTERLADPGPERRIVSLLTDGEGGLAGWSYKRYPMPLSEYWPLGDLLPFLYTLTPKMNRIAGGEQPPLPIPGGPLLGSYVCYDGMLPDSARALTLAGAGILLNPSSDQWSKDPVIQPYQALAVTSLRAVENRRWLLRSTPSGMSTVVDAAGRVVAKIGVGDRGVIVERIPVLEGLPLAARLGDWPNRLLALLCLGLWIFGRTSPGPLKF